MNTLKKFEQYLHTLEHTPSTRAEHMANVKRFIHWSQQHNYSGVEHFTYSELMGYVQDFRNREIKTGSIKIVLNSLGKYYTFLKTEGVIENNPVKKIRLKAAPKNITVQPFAYNELGTLYHAYAGMSTAQRERYYAHVRARHLRNTLLLGLVVWQGLHTREIKNLKVTDINLSEGILSVKTSSRSNGRTLMLESCQVIPFHTYLTAERNVLLPKGEELITGDVNNLSFRIAQELKGIDTRVEDMQQLRASVILHWLKIMGKRQVQYLLGFKHISSLEIYQRQEIDTLSDQLSLHHPFA